MRAERNKAQADFRAWAEQREKERRKTASFDNPLSRPWAELGEKFGGIADGEDKSFNSHWTDAKRGEHDRWEWAEKLGIEPGKPTPLPAEMEKVAEKTERIGGDDISAKSTTEIREMFNLRDILYGSWVADDLPTAQWHVRRAAEGLADLADVTGIPRELISLNGRVSLAIGLRDKSDAHATYWPTDRTINMDKTIGAGSLAHEWFHAFDNLIVEAMGLERGNLAYMTNPGSYFLDWSYGQQAKALNSYFEAPEGSEEKSKAREKCEALGVEIPETPTEEYRIKVFAAFAELKKAMIEGDVSNGISVKYSLADRFKAHDKIRENAGGLGGAIYRAKDFHEASKIILKRSKSEKERAKWLTLAAAYHLGESREGSEIYVKTEGSNSLFLAEAKDLDTLTKKDKPYYSTLEEMGARAFAEYVKDKLSEQGRRNDYLTRYTDDYRRVPLGEERERINAAFDKLFRVIAETNAIRKALDAVAKRKRWLWADGDGKIWVRKGILKAWKKAMSE